ncbi:Acetoin dehydrogenase E2 subunit dihydrolipoyllysine-residue acetyltransferase, partial [Dysosmobacter welbionis]
SCRSAFPPPADEPAKADQQPGKADGQNNDRQRTGPLRQAEGDRPGLALQQQILAVQPGIRLGPAILTQHPEVVPLAGVRQAAVDRVGRLFQVRVLHRHGIGGARILRAAVRPGHLFRGVGDLCPAAEAAVHQDLRQLPAIRQGGGVGGILRLQGLAGGEAGVVQIRPGGRAALFRRNLRQGVNPLSVLEGDDLYHHAVRHKGQLQPGEGFRYAGRGAQGVKIHRFSMAGVADPIQS